eukprot:scaffold10113_cov150-Isochrysis_galbana.AAC.4
MVTLASKEGRLTQALAAWLGLGASGLGASGALAGGRGVIGESDRLALVGGHPWALALPLLAPRMPPRAFSEAFSVCTATSPFLRSDKMQSPSTESATPKPKKTPCTASIEPNSRKNVPPARMVNTMRRV